MKYTNSSVKKTLDIQHTSKLSDFETREGKIHAFKDGLVKLTGKLSVLEEERSFYNETKVPDKLLESYLNLCDEKRTMEINIHDLETSCDEIDYYVNTSSLLFQYNDLVEKGMNELNNNANMSSIKDKSILKYFVPHSTSSSSPSPLEDECSCDQSNQIDDKATLLDKYLSYTETNFIKNVNVDCPDQCTNCSSTNRNIMVNDGYIFCNNCDSIEYIIVDHERPSYRDPPKYLWALKSRPSLCWLVC